ncbi:MAG: hypothetical protein DRP22_01350 [Verrucomicrobia bacterium]|nr:MAG: hypothetical protein DRP22_01350 [Verrucomicrobiota bacterium]
MKGARKYFGSLLSVPVLAIGTICSLGETDRESAPATILTVSPPDAVRLTIMDTGGAMLEERRQANLPPGLSRMVIYDVPDSIDLLSFQVEAGRDPEFSVLSQRFEYDAASARTFLEAVQPSRVAVESDHGTDTGTLVRSLWTADGRLDAVLLQGDHHTLRFLAGNRIRAIDLLEGLRLAVRPRLKLLVRSGSEGIHHLRLSYSAAGISWKVFYNLLLPAENRTADLWCHAAIDNRTCRKFDDAEIILACTESGLDRVRRRREQDALEPLGPEPDLVYEYGRPGLVMLEDITGPGVVEQIRVAGRKSLPARSSVCFRLFRRKPEVDLFLVYDGVRFCRYRSRRRNDWNWGTESHSRVDRYVEFVNDGESVLPPGTIRVFRRREDGSTELVGEDLVPLVRPRERCSLRLGPAAGLRGERRRLTYTEVVPFHVYEESFEITLVNRSGNDHRVRVVEHLYRWHDYEIVRADTEYSEIAPQTIEFRPIVKAGGRRIIRYTVRYRW